MHTDYDRLCGLVLTSPEVKTPNLNALQKYFPDRELLLASDCPEVSINTWVEVADLIIIMGRSAYTISYLMRRVLKAMETVDNEPEVYYYTNETNKPRPLKNWTDYQCRYDDFKLGQMSQENWNLSKDTLCLLQYIPELKDIPVSQLAEYLYGYVIDKAPAYDIEIFSTPIEVEKMCTYHNRDWNTKHGYSLDYATVHCEERFKADYLQLKIRIEGLSDTLKKYKKGTLTFSPKCSYEILYEQLVHMNNYLNILKERARIEGIELGE